MLLTNIDIQVSPYEYLRNNILDISGQLNIKSGHGSTDNSGIRFYGNDIRIDGVVKNYSNNFIGITADASGEDIMYHLPYDGKGNTLKDISDCNIIATQCYVNKNASKAVNNRGQSFFEIMTEQPEMFTLENSSNNGNITIEWHYNDIIPIIDVFPCNLLLAAKKSTYKDKQLPYIDKIYIDVSGSVNDAPSGESGSASSNDSNKWLRHDVINISDNGYNQNADKIFIFNKKTLSNIYQSSILNIFGKDSSANSFDVRVYGENFADKGNPNCPFPDPTDNSTFSNVYPKALIITDLFFPGAKPPSKPQRDSESVTFNSINLSLLSIIFNETKKFSFLKLFFNLNTYSPISDFSNLSLMYWDIILVPFLFIFLVKVKIGFSCFILIKSILFSNFVDESFFNFSTIIFFLDSIYSSLSQCLLKCKNVSILARISIFA